MRHAAESELMRSVAISILMFAVVGCAERGPECRARSYNSDRPQYWKGDHEVCLERGKLGSYRYESCMRDFGWGREKRVPCEHDKADAMAQINQCMDSIDKPGSETTLEDCLALGRELFPGYEPSIEVRE